MSLASSASRPAFCRSTSQKSQTGGPGPRTAKDRYEYRLSATVPRIATLLGVLRCLCRPCNAAARVSMKPLRPFDSKGSVRNVPVHRHDLEHCCLQSSSSRRRQELSWHRCSICLHLFDWSASAQVVCLSRGCQIRQKAAHWQTGARRHRAQPPSLEQAVLPLRPIPLHSPRPDVSHTETANSLAAHCDRLRY